MRRINLNRNFVQFTIAEDEYLEHMHRRYKDVKGTIQRKMVVGAEGYPKNDTGQLSASLNVYRNDNRVGIKTSVKYAPIIEHRRKFFRETYDDLTKKKGYNVIQMKVLR